MYDLIIVGGGPSGTAAGRLAGQSGLKTLLLEKEQFPRYKPCGGAFSEQAMSYLDFEIPNSIIERDIYGSRVHFRNQMVEGYKNFRIAVLITRAILDDFLMMKAAETGIDIRHGEKAVDFNEDIDHVEVTTNIQKHRGRFLIIAEGAQGPLKCKIRKRDEKSEYGICVVTEIEEDDDKIERYIRNAIEIHFGVADMGYGWIFPHKNYFSVGIGGFAKDLSNPRKVFADFLRSNGFHGNYKFRGHTIPAGGIKRKTVSPRAILVGDAGGFVDSFCGEGLAFAIRSGQIAVEVICDVLQNPKEVRTLNDFEARCEREFAYNLRYSLKLAKLMHSFPSLFSGFLLTTQKFSISILRWPLQEYLIGISFGGFFQGCIDTFFLNNLLGRQWSCFHQTRSSSNLTWGPGVRF
jgi:geranylgeranyl reductase family protein